MAEIAPFRVMQILARAREMETAGVDVVHMEIGEPDFATPAPMVRAAEAAMRAGLTHYTPAAGLPRLREAIARYYTDEFGVTIEASRIIVTPGASGALQLALGVHIDPGDKVLLTDPGYPCNRHIVSLLGGEAVSIPVHRKDGFAVTPAALSAAVDDRTRALMLASPANPTGNSVDNAELQALHTCLRRAPGALLICDEIYQGLEYPLRRSTALALDTDNLVVINSFSKFFSMTGWRVGWVVAPPGLIEPMERLAQNLFLAASTPGQHAALAAFDPESRDILEQRRQLFEQRRNFLHEAVVDMGFDPGPRPGGAFYLYADAGKFTDDSLVFCDEVLRKAGVAITPGIDFGSYQAQRHVRFAYTTDLANLERGVARLDRFLRAGGG